VLTWLCVLLFHVVVGLFGLKKKLKNEKAV